MSIKTKATLLICTLLCSFIFAAKSSNGGIKKIANDFFKSSSQSYVELKDVENDDLYFLGKNDLIFYPAYLNPNQDYEHWIFEKKIPSLDGVDLDDDIDFRSCRDASGNYHMILKSGKTIFIKQKDASYLKFSMKK